QIGSNPFFSEARQVEETQIVEEIAKGAVALAQKGLGALIVIEREIALEYFIEEGTILNADVDADLMLSLFQPQSPLHDGAVIIRGGRIYSAGCFLPLSKNPVLDKNLGTRHRAAIGLTEETDALVLVVSEEKKSVSVAEAGSLKPDLDHPAIRKLLYEGLELRFKPGRGAN
ncbi:MAG: DNA integrity scanning protein DisA nucleotide-binding domain protein, partial [Bdellovibrionales bacterium]|nr:DNA integrity scanning protein DisA nucleotide-binding domain protein [Bdellovibrionales bacterium]